MSVNKKDPESPATTSAAWDEMWPKWHRMDTLLAGTDAMRAAGRTYLPQHEEESDANYNERLDRTTLFNMTELTLDSLVGKPFSDPLTLNDDVPDEVAALTNNMDLQGNSLHVVAREWFREGVAKGHAHVLVDFPAMTMDERVTRTRADDMAEARRPYWQVVNPDNVIFASSEIVNGREMLTQVRIMEIETRMSGFAEDFVRRVRVLFPGGFQVWEEVSQPRKRKTQWVMVEEGETGLPFIPMVTFYTNRLGLMFSKPPLDDLALLNVRHWQSTSDQISVLTVARFPILAVAGAVDTDGDTMKIGPKQLLGTKDPTGRFYYVEHSGAAIEAGARELEVLEEKMAAYGAEFLRRKPGNQTATARALDSSESVSPLQDYTVRFMETVALALDYTAAWIGGDKGGTVKMPLDFGPDVAEPIDFRSLNEARRNRDLSRASYLRELSRRGQLADDFDEEQNEKELADEPEFESPFASGRNVRGGGSTSTEDVGEK